MADEDDFDIDIYGDEKPELVPEPADDILPDESAPTVLQGVGVTRSQQVNAEPESEPTIDPGPPPEPASLETKADEPMVDANARTIQTAGAIGLATQDASQESAPTSNVAVEPGATSALRLGEVQWWITEDEIRGWANKNGVEDQLKEITFNEQKINGKSKGDVYILFQTPLAATVVKKHIAGVVALELTNKRITASFTSPDYNPYKNVKDGGAKPKDSNFSSQKPYNSAGYNNQGGFRGGRGGYNRGAYNNAGARGGFGNQQNPQMGGYTGTTGMTMGNFGGNNMGFNRGSGMTGMSRGGFQNGRGRGGVGMMGMTPNMGMGMGMMDMSQMAAMGMGMAGGGLNFGAFFPQGGGQGHGGDANGNPHGAKRPRPET